MSLKKQAVSGLVWTFSQQIGYQLISFTVGIILARILAPADFGLIAMFTVVMAVATALTDGGMTASLIRSKDLDELDFSTVFWFNIGTAIVLYILIYLTSPLIASFFDEAVLTNVIRVYSIILLINSFGAVQNAQMTRDMNFRSLFKVQVPSLMIAGIAAVIMALNEFGVWTLVFYPIIQSVCYVIQIWLYSKWRPSFSFSKNKFRYHFNFGYKLTLSGLLDKIFANIYTVIIGKFFSPADLGFYNRADTLKQLPVSNLSTALNKVTYPLFAKISHEQEKLKTVYKKLMKVVVFILAPILCLMASTAEPLIRFLLTEKWMPAIPYFQILAIAGILYPIHAYNLNILKVKGRSDLILKLEFIKKVLVIVILALSIPFGVIGIVWGQVIFSILAFFINTYYTDKILDYNFIEQGIDLLPSIILSLMIGGGIYYLNSSFFLDIPDFLRLVISGFIFVSLYLSAVFLMKFNEIRYVKELLKR
ncbi:MAG: lipopolysaccharide biosynthesis protein [Weeksellaceae bacterium]|nr:lipopolysaccharide biosynthesis protein [Weeksellaceae bacterium]